MRRITALLLLFVFFAGSAFAAVSALPSLRGWEPDNIGDIAGELSTAMARGLRNTPTLSALAPALRSRLGHRLQNGVYVSDTMLIEDFTPPDPAAIAANTEALSQLLDGLKLSAVEYGWSSPLYFMLVPTASSVKKGEVPGHAYPLDQRQMISAIYYQNNLPESPTFNPVRAHEALDRVNSAYIYYRTDWALTGLGGYYLYLDLADTMRLTPYTLGHFNVSHVRHDYRGGLSHRAYSNHIRPDLISIYQFADDTREYRVVHQDGEATKYYNTLFPLHVMEIGEPTDVVLGGLSPRIDIRSASLYSESLLILTDDTVKSYISFLALHFEHITILDVSAVNDAWVADIDLMDYDRILISLSFDLYAHSDRPAGAMRALRDRVLPIG